MTELAVKIGILCPQSRYVQWNSDISSIQYPCLIKPSHQKPGHFNEFKFKICNDKDSLKGYLSSFAMILNLLFKISSRKKRYFSIWGENVGW